MLCGTIVTPTSARFVERVTVGSTSASRTILRSSLLVVFLVAPDPVFRAKESVPQNEKKLLASNAKRHRPSGIVVSEADCGAVGTGFNSRRRRGCLCCNPSFLLMRSSRLLLREPHMIL
ncbi:hypothetical protein TNCV_1953021 [Trichonephila clavipes]|nr:hypothetical protein TNCV_1953021 [Trichonephila clavipes]